MFDDTHQSLHCNVQLPALTLPAWLLPLQLHPEHIIKIVECQLMSLLQLRQQLLLCGLLPGLCHFLFINFTTATYQSCIVSAAVLIR